MNPEMYRLPQSLAVDPLAHRRLRGELILSFGGSILLGCTYQPLGLNSLWSLIGAVAALRSPFLFEIRPSMTAVGLCGGFAAGKFCLFDVRNKYVEVLTSHSIDPIGDSKVTIHDERHGTFYWIPTGAMSSFEDIVRTANAVLLSLGVVQRTPVFQGYSNWLDDIYTGEP